MKNYPQQGKSKSLAENIRGSLDVKLWHAPLKHILALMMIISFICSACGSGAMVSSSSATKTSHTATVLPVATRQALKNPVVYVAMGASDAVGVGSNEPGAQGYVPLVEERLPQGSHLVNLGVSGIRLHQALQQELPVALSTAPQLITIWLVANDFVAGVPYADYMSDLTTLLKQLHEGTQASIAMANLPDLTLLPAFAHSDAAHKATTRQEIQRWNTQIATIAHTYKVTVVDLFGENSLLTAHPEYISADGFHPSPAGYVELANLFWQAIQQQNPA